jgi:type IV secretory pathway VirB10-like protein
MAGARKRRGVVIGIVAAVVIAGGAVAVLAFGGGTKKPTPAPAPTATTDVAMTAPVTAPVKPEPVKPEPVKPEPVKPEPVAVDPTKIDPVPAKPEPAKLDPGKHAKPGTLAITIAGAQKGNILVDGKRVGSNVATISIELAPGDHRVRVEAPGHRPVQHVVRVEAGANQPLSVPLGAKSIDTIHDPFAE